jgi:hypothetical protein
VGEKIGKAWLVAYLQDPSKMVANSRMPLFEWKEEEASVLATYLLGKGAAVAPSPQITQIERDHTAGEAAQIGCFQCHRVRSFVRTLDLPQPESASGFVGFHVRKNSRIPMDLPPSQVKAMAEALFFPTEPTVSDEDFLKAFWETPIPLQGPAPAVHDSLSSGLKPSDCASCHIKQHREWQESLHAAAMGPGVFGQLADHTFSSPGFAGSCQECHAPNSEQYGSLPASDDYEVNYQFDLSLREEGITCLACHVRGRARFGPPISERPPASIWAGSGHGGAHETTAHQNPTFCSSCHQFEEGDRRLNGKLIQDTFREWEASPQAQQGQTCQTCHMPGRSHRWAGIHDPATVESAIEVGVDIEETGGDSIVAFVQIKNVGAGHHLPTYVTPKIFVTAHLVASSGETLQETALTRSIGREIQLDSEVSREVYDTRIPAGGTWWWRYAVLRSPRASEIAVRLEVFPDHFYARFFDSYDSSSLSNEASAAIAVARENANSSSYIVHEMAIPIQVSSDK